MRYMIRWHHKYAYGDELLRCGKIYFCTNGVHDGLLLGGQVYVGSLSICAATRNSRDIPGLLVLGDDLKKSVMIQVF